MREGGAAKDTTLQIKVKLENGKRRGRGGSQVPARHAAAVLPLAHAQAHTLSFRK